MGYETDNYDPLIEEATQAIRGLKTLLIYMVEERDGLKRRSGVSAAAKAEMQGDSVARTPSLTAMDTQIKVVKELFKPTTPVVRKIRHEYLDVERTERNPDFGKFAEIDADGKWTNLDGLTGLPVVVFDPATL